MSAPAIRGWCPGAHKPMASGDGLVVRVRPALGALTAEQACGLADAAERFGNGLIDLTNRANLQLRGVRAATHEPLLAKLSELGLLDVDPSVEGRRNIVLDPFRSIGSDDLQTRIATQLAKALAAPDLADLPSKFGFVIDAGPARSLAEISGDIRVESAGETLIVRADGCATGRAARDAEAAVGLAIDLARWFITSGGVGADGRGRMARHLASGQTLPAGLFGAASPNAAAAAPYPGIMRNGLLVAAGFGQLRPQDLRRLAGAARRSLRITPWRMVFLPDLLDAKALDGWDALITDPDNPLRRLHACTGAPGCPQASVETRALASALALYLPRGMTLHVSGCTKGCAHPAVSDLTVVGHDGLFDLVRNGTAWDEPEQRGVKPADLPDLING